MTHTCDFEGHGMCADRHAEPVRLTTNHIIDMHGNRWDRADGRLPGRPGYSHTTAEVDTLLPMLPGINCRGCAGTGCKDCDGTGIYKWKTVT